MHAGAIAGVAIAGLGPQSGVVQARQIPGSILLHRQPWDCLRLHLVIHVNGLDAGVPLQGSQLAGGELQVEKWRCDQN